MFFHLCWADISCYYLPSLCYLNESCDFRLETVIMAFKRALQAVTVLSVFSYMRHKKVRSCFQHYYRSKIVDFKGCNQGLC